MAGQFSYEAVWFVSDGRSGERMASLSGQAGVGPGDNGRRPRISHLDPTAPSSAACGYPTTTSLCFRVTASAFATAAITSWPSTEGLRHLALRPRGEVGVQLSPNWHGFGFRQSQRRAPGRARAAFQEGACESTLNALDTFPTLMTRHSRPVLEGSLHEEMAIERAFGENARSLERCGFHDDARPTLRFSDMAPPRPPISSPIPSRSPLPTMEVGRARPEFAQPTRKRSDRT